MTILEYHEVSEYFGGNIRETAVDVDPRSDRVTAHDLGHDYPVLVSDVDGTLLSSSGRPSNLLETTLEEYMRRGGHVVLATGKIFGAIADVCRRLSCTDPQITVNGAVLVKPQTGDRRIMSRVQLDDLARLETILARDRIPYVYYESDAIFYRRGYLDEVYMDILRGFGEDYLYATPPEGPEDRSEVVKVLSFVRNGDLERTLRRRVAGACPSLSVTRTTVHYLEYMDRATSKLAALRCVLAELGYTLADTIAFGDEENDLDIVREAGLGIAVANATERVRAAADYITASNESDGVAQFVERFLLQGRKMTDYSGVSA